MLKGFHHVAIICSDYPRSKAFYKDVLGFSIIDENYREARDSYKCDLGLPDGSQIELFSFPGAPQRPSRPEAQGLRHLAFKVDNLDEVIPPWTLGDCRHDRDAVGLFFRHVVHMGFPIVDFADFVAGTGVEENSLGQRGLAGIDVRGNADVSNLL